MFSWATSFNGDISKWDVSRVTNMDNMFQEAVSFDRRLCGAAWVRSTASQIGMFEGSAGSISRTVCPSTPRRPKRDREPRRDRALILPHSPMTTQRPSTVAITPTTPTCPECGTFEKSGRDSCCAPGGAWYNKCGGAGSRTLEHRWIEGVQACTRKFARLRACWRICWLR